MPRINKTRFALLGFLTIEPMSAYEMKKMIAQSTAYFWTESDGQLYPMLSKLTQEGCATCKEKVAQSGGVKKVYSITKKGQRQLHSWLQDNNAHNTFRSEFLLKIFFGGNADKSSLISLLERECKDSCVVLQQLQLIVGRMQEMDLTDFNRYCRYLTVDYGVTTIKAEIAWMRKVIKQLNK